MFGGYREFCKECHLINGRVANASSQSKDAFIYSNDTWKKVDELSPCEDVDFRHVSYATCAKRRKSGNDYEIVIPTFDFSTMKRCTAILDLQTLKWSTLDEDNDRLAISKGTLISVANETRVLYVGGHTEQRKWINTVYELIAYKKWILRPEAILPNDYITGNPHVIPYFPIHLEHCQP